MKISSTLNTLPQTIFNTITFLYDKIINDNYSIRRHHQRRLLYENIINDELFLYKVFIIDDFYTTFIQKYHQR